MTAKSDIANINALPARGKCRLKAGSRKAKRVVRRSNSMKVMTHLAMFFVLALAAGGSAVAAWREPPDDDWDGP